MKRPFGVSCPLPHFQLQPPFFSDQELSRREFDILRGCSQAFLTKISRNVHEWAASRSTECLLLLEHPRNRFFS